MQKSKHGQEKYHFYAACSIDLAMPTMPLNCDQDMPLVTVSPGHATVSLCRWGHPSVAL